jgi:hypothetical protein
MRDLPAQRPPGLRLPYDVCATRQFAAAGRAESVARVENTRDAAKLAE